MSKGKKFKEESGPGVPAYIVTFSDMVTLLLTFFVLLLSMANTQEETLFRKGQESFNKATANFGLVGIMKGKPSVSEFEYDVRKYRLDKGKDNENDEPATTNVDNIQRVANDLEKLAVISPSNIKGKPIRTLSSGIKFAQSSWELGEKGKVELGKLAVELRSELQAKPIGIYIVGFSKRAGSEANDYIVSARRAATVAEYLKKNLPESVGEHIFPWGAGSGGEWVGRSGTIREDADILICTIVRSSN